MSLFKPGWRITVFTSQASCIAKTPPELWHQILDMATSIDDYDEFGEKGGSSTSLEHGEEVFPCVVPPREQQLAFRYRLGLALVCQAWHPIAIRFLWSHVTLDIESWTRESFISVTEAHHYLWAFVKRLDIIYLPSRYPEESEPVVTAKFNAFLSVSVYPHLVRLRVLCTPQNLATGIHSLEPEIVSLYPAGLPLPDFDIYSSEGDFLWDGGSHFWKSAKILDLDLDMSQVSEPTIPVPAEDIIFPNLVKICIRSACSDSIVHHITTYWKAPSLLVLSLKMTHADTEVWWPLLLWARTTVETLHISTPSLHTATGTILFPALTSLSLEHCFRSAWYNMLDAPYLNRISFTDAAMDAIFERQRPKFARSVTRALENSTKCTRISYYTLEMATVYDDANDTRTVTERVPTPSLVFSFDPTSQSDRALAVKNGWLLEVLD